MVDNTSRFWISSIVNQHREIADARAVFKDGRIKLQALKLLFMIGFSSYDEAFQREYFTLKNPRVKNIPHIGKERRIKFHSRTFAWNDKR